MEDLFQIIFVVIFILSSIISSINKKKKKQAKKTANLPTKSPAKPAAVSQRKQKSSAEILEEMLGFKVNIPEPSTKRAPTNYSEENLQTSSWDPAKDFEVEEKTDDGKSNYEDKITEKKSEIHKAQQKHRAFKNEHVKVKKIVKSSDANQLFSSETNLKDYIIIQEILNKPKALRR